LKAADSSGQAFEQIKQYERDIPRLFYPNAFNIVTDGMATLYGATAPAKFYAPWPDPWPRSRDEFADDLSKDLWCLLEPSRLLDLLAHFIVFVSDPDTGRRIKKVCRYQQFRAVNKTVNRVAEGDQEKGADLAHPRLGQEPDDGVSRPEAEDPSDPRRANAPKPQHSRPDRPH